MGGRRRGLVITRGSLEALLAKLSDRMGPGGGSRKLPLDHVSVILGRHFTAFFHSRIYLFTDSYQASVCLPQRRAAPASLSSIQGQLPPAVLCVNKATAFRLQVAAEEAATGGLGRLGASHAQPARRGGALCGYSVEPREEIRFRPSVLTPEHPHPLITQEVAGPCQTSSRILPTTLQGVCSPFYRRETEAQQV